MSARERRRPPFSSSSRYNTDLTRAAPLKEINFRISRRRRQPQKLFRQRAVVVNKFGYDWLARLHSFRLLLFSRRASGRPVWSARPLTLPFPSPADLVRIRESTRHPPLLLLLLVSPFAIDLVFPIYHYLRTETVSLK